MRLFAALPVPHEQAERLVPLQKGLAGASWRPVENFHITLRFFGDVDRPLALDLDEELAQIDMSPFLLSLSGAGWFGRREPYSVWAGVAENPDLIRLAKACERAARRIGLPPEKRSYRPHVTLAYCHGTSLEAARAWSERCQVLQTEAFWADRFHLYSSHTGKGPSRYVAEAEYPLA